MTTDLCNMNTIPIGQSIFELHRNIFRGRNTMGPIRCQSSYRCAAPSQGPYILNSSIIAVSSLLSMTSPISLAYSYEAPVGEIRKVFFPPVRTNQKAVIKLVGASWWIGVDVIFPYYYSDICNCCCTSDVYLLVYFCLYQLIPDQVYSEPWFCHLLEDGHQCLEVWWEEFHGCQM